MEAGFKRLSLTGNLGDALVFKARQGTREYSVAIRPDGSYTQTELRGARTLFKVDSGALL